MHRSLPARPAIALPWRPHGRRRHLRRELRLPRPLARARAAVARALARRRVRIALVCALVAIPLLTGSWLWFRKSGFVAVEKVRISGLAGPQEHAIEAALRSAAHGMSTLDLDGGALRSAVAQFAVVRGLHFSTRFPHTLVVAVTERPPVAELVVDGARMAVAADGLVLGPAVIAAGLPSVSARWQPQPGQSVHEGGVLAELAVLGVAPKALAARVSSVYTGVHGLTVAMRNGLLVYFGDAERAHAKWLALERVLLDEGSAGAAYIDVRMPERPAAGGFPEGVPPAVNSTAAEEGATTTDPATEASVAALAEGLRQSSPDAGSGPPVGAGEPSGQSSSPSSSNEPQVSGGHEEAAAAAPTAAAGGSASGGATSGAGSGTGEPSASAPEDSSAGGAAAAPGG